MNKEKSDWNPEEGNSEEGYKKPFNQNKESYGNRPQRTFTSGAKRTGGPIYSARPTDPLPEEGVDGSIKRKRPRVGESGNAYGSDRPAYGGGYGSNRPGGGYGNSSYGNRPSGGYGAREGGYSNRESSYGNREGGYGNREGGYGNRESSYGNRESGYGNREGGYQGGGYSHNRPSSGYGHREGGYGNREGGYGNREGGYNNEGGNYGNRAGGGNYGNSRPGGGYGGGGYNNRGGGYGNRPGGGYNRPGADSRFKPRAGAKFSPRKPKKYVEEVFNPDDPIRLNKYLANAGVCSRREADEYIQAGVVKVNGVVTSELGTKIKRGDHVMFHDQQVKPEGKVYVLLNKPKNCVTTTDDPQERLTVMNLVQNAAKERIFPVGRLDRNTTGILLLTNDGDLAAKLTHPTYLKKKIYHVWLDKPVAIEDMQKIAEGIDLEDGEIHADAISYPNEEDQSQIGIEIHSGRNRVVRRIFEKLGYRVKRLDRVYFAGLTKKNLPRGKWRYLSEKEVNILRMGSFE
jgi:23S rRNA pseudouridine2605 synthase